MRASTGALWATLATKVGADFYGPERCISVTRSPEGSCVLATNCEGRDLSKFEFAFDCTLPKGGGLERHSFGVGGFDDVEEFDTDVHCDLCAAPGVDQPQPTPSPRRTTFGKVPVQPPVQPSPQAHAVAGHAAPAHAAPVHALAMPVPHSAPKNQIHAMQRSSQPADSPGLIDDEQPGWYTPPPGPDGGESDEVVKYGPDSCVSTYRSPEGHCVVATKCAEADISDYEFGLVCVDKVGRPVRHLFGKGSFDPEEVFDTVIPCDQCLGLEDIPDSLMLNNEVIGLSKEIKDLKGMMGNITGSVTRLNSEVFAPAPAPAPVASPAAAEAPAAAAAEPAAAAAEAPAAANFVARKKLQSEDTDVDVDSDENVATDDEEAQDSEEQEVSHKKHLRHHAHKHHGHKHHRRHEDLDASEEGAEQETASRHLRKQKRAHHQRQQEADEDAVATDNQDAPAENVDPPETSDAQEEDPNAGDGFDD